MTNKDIDYSAYLYDNTFETDAGGVPTVSIISTAVLTFPLIIDGNNFSTTSENNSSNAVFLSNITGGVIKFNVIIGISNFGFVSLKVYDILGREIKTLVNEIKPAGIYKIEFDGSNFASGIYFYRFEAGDYVQTKRMVLIK